MTKIKTPDQRLIDSAALFKERNEQYGDNYLTMGDVLFNVFPQKLEVRTSGEMQRLFTIVMLTMKLTRYAQNINKGGHQDSLDDMAVYALMAAYTDDLERAKDLPKVKQESHMYAGTFADDISTKPTFDPSLYLHNAGSQEDRVNNPAKPYLDDSLHTSFIFPMTNESIIDRKNITRNQLMAKQKQRMEDHFGLIAELPEHKTSIGSLYRTYQNLALSVAVTMSGSKGKIRRPHWTNDYANVNVNCYYSVGELISQSDRIACDWEVWFVNNPPETASAG